MPVTETVPVPVTVNQNMSVTKYATKVTIIADQRVYFTVQWYHENELVKTCNYCCPYSELAQRQTTGQTWDQEIETALFEKAAEIDAMPEATDEEKAAKSERFGITV